MTNVDIVIPVYNEEQILEKNIDVLMDFLAASLVDGNYKVIIVDNGSKDKTRDIAIKLAKRYNNLAHLFLKQKGRGGALREAWLNSKADIVGYMDADLSTDLRAFPRMIDSIIKDGYDLAVGSRLLSGSQVKRSRLRTYISCSYNMLLRPLFNIRLFSDVQCGCKFLSRHAVNELISEIKNDNWFFDTELLILAEANGFKVKDIPVAWKERIASKVSIFEAIHEDITGIFRLLFSRLFRRINTHSNKK